MPTEEEMYWLLYNIYVARNITFNKKLMQDCLKQVDAMFSSESGRN